MVLPFVIRELLNKSHPDLFRCPLAKAITYSVTMFSACGPLGP